MQKTKQIFWLLGLGLTWLMLPQSLWATKSYVQSNLSYADGFEGRVRASLALRAPPQFAVLVQPSLTTWRTAQKEQWVDLGVGLVARHSFGENHLAGINMFYDHNTNHNLGRLGVGTDWQSRRLYVFANAYFGLSDGKQGKDGYRLHVSDGAELGAELRVEPFQLGLTAGAWQGVGRQTTKANITDWDMAWGAHARWHVTRLVSLKGEYRSPSYGQGDDSMAIGLELQYPRLEKTPRFQTDMYRLVERQTRLLHARTRSGCEIVPPSLVPDAPASGLLDFCTHPSPLRIGSQAFRIEVADTDAKHRQGLMFRRSLAANAGMLFVYPNARRVLFFMRNTYIPLDIIFIRADKTIAKIVTRRDTRSDTVTSSGEAVQFVLEINAGRAAALGIEEGQPVSHPLLD